MKKTVIIAAVAALMGTSGYFSYKTIQPNAQIPNLHWANVEALADEEIGNGTWVVTVYSPTHWDCTPNGGASCPGTPW